MNIKSVLACSFEKKMTRFLIRTSAHCAHRSTWSSQTHFPLGKKIWFTLLSPHTSIHTHTHDDISFFSFHLFFFLNCFDLRSLFFLTMLAMAMSPLFSGKNNPLSFQKKMKRTKCLFLFFFFLTLFLCVRVFVLCGDVSCGLVYHIGAFFFLLLRVSPTPHPCPCFFWRVSYPLWERARWKSSLSVS